MAHPILNTLAVLSVLGTVWVLRVAHGFSLTNREARKADRAWMKVWEDLA